MVAVLAKIQEKPHRSLIRSDEHYHHFGFKTVGRPASCFTRRSFFVLTGSPLRWTLYA